MKNNISIVFPEIKSDSGTKTYVQNTLSSLNKVNLLYKRVPVKKIELSLLGKPYFGVLFQYLFSAIKSDNSKVVHALSNDVAIRGTNLVTIHDIIPYTNPDIYMNSTYDKIAYRLSYDRSLKVENILLSTQVGKKSFLKCMDIDQDRIKVINIPINHSYFYPGGINPYPDNGKVHVLMVSDFNPRKRIDIIIKELAGNPEIEFYHIGPTQGWVARSNELVGYSKKFENIKFLGQKNIQEVREYMAAADLFLYLSDNEGYGLPPIEAMACGTNVVVNDIPVFKEILGDKAKYVELSKFSSQDLIKAIAEKRDKDTLVNFTQRYSLESYGKKLNDLYSYIMAQ